MSLHAASSLLSSRYEVAIKFRILTTENMFTTLPALRVTGSWCLGSTRDCTMEVGRWTGLWTPYDLRCGLVHNRVWAVSYLDQRAECQPFRRLMTHCRSPHPRTKPCALRINTEPPHQFQVSIVNVQERVFVVRRWGLLSALNPNSSKHLAEPA